MPWPPRPWWLWFVLWRACMWMAVRSQHSALTWFDWAYAFGRRCRAAGGPRVTGVVTLHDDPEL